MNYFRIHESCEPDIVGTYPQIQSAVVPTTIDDNNYIGQFNFTELSPGIQVPKGLLDRKAKVTDLVSTSFPGLTDKRFISDKFYNVLSQSKYTGLQFIETLLMVNKTTNYRYWIINPFQSMYNNLDLEKSSFFHHEGSFSPAKKQLYFENAASIAKVQNSMPVGHFLKIENVVFKDQLHDDFFCLKIVEGGIGFYVSEPLKAGIIENNCTGVVFTEPNHFYPR